MEIWKKIKDYPDYEVSSFGRIKSLKFGKEIIKKQTVNSNGYPSTALLKNGIQKTKTVHQLVAIAFLNHVPSKQKFVVNHKDFDRTNNRVENLEIVTTRENTSNKQITSSSKYVGVSWCKANSKWGSSIRINGKSKNIGYFLSEIEAANAYQKQLQKL